MNMGGEGKTFRLERNYREGSAVILGQEQEIVPIDEKDDFPVISYLDFDAGRGSKVGEWKKPVSFNFQGYVRENREGGGAWGKGQESFIDEMRERFTVSRVEDVPQVDIWVQGIVNKDGQQAKSSPQDVRAYEISCQAPGQDMQNDFSAFSPDQRTSMKLEFTPDGQELARRKAEFVKNRLKDYIVRVATSGAGYPHYQETLDRAAELQERYKIDRSGAATVALGEAERARIKHKLDVHSYMRQLIDQIKDADEVAFEEISKPETSPLN